MPKPILPDDAQDSDLTFNPEVELDRWFGAPTSRVMVLYCAALCSAALTGLFLCLVAASLGAPGPLETLRTDNISLIVVVAFCFVTATATLWLLSRARHMGRAFRPSANGLEIREFVFRRHTIPWSAFDNVTGGPTTGYVFSMTSHRPSRLLLHPAIDDLPILALVVIGAAPALSEKWTLGIDSETLEIVDLEADVSPKKLAQACKTLAQAVTIPNGASFVLTRRASEELLYEPQDVQVPDSIAYLAPQRITITPTAVFLRLYGADPAPHCGFCVLLTPDRKPESHWTTLDPESGVYRYSNS